MRRRVQPPDKALPRTAAVAGLDRQSTLFVPPRASIIRAIIGCWVLCFLAGCLAPPKRHAWQITREDAAQIQGAATWALVSTNDYVRVLDAKRADAVALLQKHAFVQLDSSQLSIFAPSLTSGTGQAYLVRGVLFSSPPLFTIIRFDPVTARLLVQQFTYDGEMMMPFRWVAEPNALVIFLPRSPGNVFPDAVLGGDWIARGRQWSTLDKR